MTLKDPKGTSAALKRFTRILQRLEIGCGEGRLTWKYAVPGSSVVGIDPDLDSLRIARVDCPLGLHDSVRFTGASALNLPFPHEKFDLAILSWSL
jgi:ubiquinone/menaquinone biosynthesis C-methylase UbiE